MELFPSSRASKVFHLLFATLPGGFMVALLGVAVSDPVRLLKQPVVPILAILFFALLTAVVVYRAFDRVILDGTTLRVRALRTWSIDLRHDVIFWGQTSQRAAGDPTELLVLHTTSGHRSIPLAHLQGRGRLVQRIAEICGPPAKVVRRGGRVSFE